ncbi:MAG: type II 3-dehydroquinate dehydratase [Acholeplasmataceae bacterium]
MTITIINGPNLNKLNKRDKSQYGNYTLKEINQLIKKTFPNHKFIFYQSNHEGKIIDYLQKIKSDALIINPAAFTHTSIGIRDTLEMILIPKVEVHLSNPNNREDFRKINYIKDVVNKTFKGLKEQSYIEAIKYIINQKEIN